MTFEREIEVRSKAIEVLKQYKSHLDEPISIYQILHSSKSHKISLKYSYLAGLLGITIFFPDMNEYLIVTDVAQNNIFERHKFTIGHELGHIFLDHFNCSCKNSIVITNPEIEREADTFSEELLMPTQDIILKGYNSPEQICEIYCVSKQAATNKLKYLKYNAIYQDFINVCDQYYESNYPLKYSL